MLDAMRRWFESLGQQDGLFEDTEDEILHAALASVLFHFISADSRVSGRERREFERILQEDLGVGQARAAHLYEAASTCAGDLLRDLETVSTHLKAHPGVRMAFMRQLIRLVQLDGTREEELELFRRTLYQVFPDLGPA